jgi:hypothetical protein
LFFFVALFTAPVASHTFATRFSFTWDIAVTVCYSERKR